MKKKLLYTILSFVFSVAFVCTGAAFVSVNGTVTGNASPENESVSVSQTADAYGVTYTHSSIAPSDVSGKRRYTVSYSNAVQTITLPAGEYRLEAYGASGGAEQSAASTVGNYLSGQPNTQNSTYNSYVTTYGGNTTWRNWSSRAGAGGYAAGTLKLTSSTTLYLAVGGVGGYGSGSAAYGGFNGGANGSVSANGGGGGASDIRIGGNSLYYRILVAGGGGGADNGHGTGNGRGTDDDGTGGAGGGATAERAIAHSTYVGSAATQSGGYSFGNGQIPTVSTDTGGGGGGWYGGYASNDNQGGGGGGSGYVLTSSSYRPSGYAHSTSSPYNMSDAVNVCGIWTGNGKILITMNDAPPVTKNATIASVTRGTATAATVPTTLASDIDTYNTLYWHETNRIYTDSACTVLAGSDLLSVSGMTAGASGGFTITPKKWIAAGTTFYVKIRDNYGGATSGLIGNIAFKFGTSDNALTAYTAPTSWSGVNYRVGPSNQDSTDGTDGLSDPSKIYNPNGKNRYTVFVTKPIADSYPVTIEASKLFTDADAPNYDTILVTAITNATTSAYTVTGNEFLTAGYKSVTVTHNNAAVASSGYLGTVTLRVQSMETNTGLLMGSAATVELVFKIDNTRPKLLVDVKSGKSGNDLLLTMKAGESKTVGIEEFSYDNDRNRNEIKQVKVPEKEFIYVDINGNKLTGSAVFRGETNYDIADNNVVPGESGSVKTAEGTKSLKFEHYGICDSSDSAESLAEAYLSYTIDPSGQSITINALRATRYQYEETGRKGDFYFLVRIEDKGDTADTGIWLPIAVKVVNTAPTQAASVAIAEYTESDAKANNPKETIFSPMGIGVTDPAHVLDAANTDEKQLHGVAEDKDNFSTFVSNSYADTFKNLKAFQMYNEFLVFDVAAMGLYLNDETKTVSTPFYELSLVPLYAPMSVVAKIAKAHTLGATQSAVTDPSWKRYDDWASDSKDIELYGDDKKIVKFWGLKIKYLRSTMGNYIQVPVVVKDVRGNASLSSKTAPDGNLDGLVNVLVKVCDTGITVHDAGNIAATNGKIKARYYDANAQTVDKTSYIGVTAAHTGSASGSTPATITYSVPRGYTFELTPYDIASDIDTVTGWIIGENTNPCFSYENKSGGGAVAKTDYTTQLTKSEEPYMCYYTANPLSLSATENGLLLNTLTFSGSPQVANTTVGNAETDSSVKYAGKLVKITTTSRTSSANPLSFIVKISDGETATVDVRIVVNILNNVPMLRESANNVFYLSSNYLGLNSVTENSSLDYSVDNYQNTSRDQYAYSYNVREFKPIDLATDFEDANLYFQNIVVKYYTKNTNGEFVVFANGADYVEASFTEASPNRNGQVLKVTAKQSTHNIPGGLFLEVSITDNYGYNTAQNTGLIKFQIEVNNSLPTVNKDVDTGFVLDNGTYSWNISPKDGNDVKADRFIVSNEKVAKFLTDVGYKASTGASAVPVKTENVRTLSKDNDIFQNLRLYAGRGNETFEDTGEGKPRIPLYAFASVNEAGQLVPDGGNNTDVAVLFTSPIDSYDSLISLVDIVYFKPNTDGTSLEQLKSPYDHVRDGVTKRATTNVSGEEAKDYVDSIYWAIKVQSKTSFARTMKMTVRVRDTAGTERATETEKAYDGKRVISDDKTAFVKNGEVDGATSLDIGVKIGAVGMRVTHKYYADHDGQYYTIDNDTDKNEQRYSFYYNGIKFTSNAAAVEVPLSYFAFSEILPGKQSEADTNKQAVSFNGYFAKPDITADGKKEVFKRISLTDGVTTWTGDKLNENPFVNVEFRVENSVPNNLDTNYYNNVLRQYTNIQESFDLPKALYENKQIFKFTPKGPRSGNSPLKLTLDLALYLDYKAETPEIAKDGEAPKSANVTVDVVIPNAVFSFRETNSNFDEDAIDGFRWDTQTAIPSSSATTTAYTFRLINSELDITEGSGGNVINLGYDDLNRIGSGYTPSDEYKHRYHDTVRFLFSSLGYKTNSADSKPDVPVLTEAQVHSFSSGTALTNTPKTSNDARKALCSYLGIDNDGSVYTKIKTMTAAELAALDPNKGYENYFDIDKGSDSDSFTIRIKNKTSINTTDKTDDQVKALAKEKHLSAEKDKSGKWQFYFPLKVIVYDSYNGSNLESGSWALLTIKVRINNSKPTVNTSLLARDTSYIPLNITIEDSYTLSLIDAVSDMDLVRTDSGTVHYKTETELTEDEKHVKDYLVYEAGDTKYNTAVNTNQSGIVGWANYIKCDDGKTITDSLEHGKHIINVTADKDKGTLTFSAVGKTVNGTTVIGKTIYVVVRIADSRGDFVNINLAVRIVDKAPELFKQRAKNDGTGAKIGNFYTASDTTVTMKTGDYFDVIVTPYDFIDKDTSVSNSIFTISEKSEDPVFKTYTYSYVTGTGRFNRNSVNIAGNVNLGPYAIADDDTARKLVISGVNSPVSAITATALASAGYSGVTHNVMYRVTAKGVYENAPLTFTVTDDTGVRLTVSFTITVKSTPPKVKTDTTPAGLKRVTDVTKATSEKVTEADITDGLVFTLETKVGAPVKEYSLKDFARDPDMGDDDQMYLYKAFSGSCFEINGAPATSSAFLEITSSSPNTKGLGDRKFAIRPTNFKDNGEFEQIVFYIMDQYGQSLVDAQKIIINVYIVPNDLKNEAAQGAQPTYVDFEVKSKTDYSKSGAKPSVLDVVTNIPPASSEARAAGSTPGLVYDPDYGSSRTSYEMRVYAMLKAKTETDEETGDTKIVGWETVKHDAFNTANVDTANNGYTPFELKRYVWDNSAGAMKTEIAGEGNEELKKYVSSYFEFDFTSDGSKLNFLPTNSTLTERIPIYVKVVKRGIAAVTTDEAARMKYSSFAYFAITVADSAPNAVAASPANASVFTGEGNFLHFIGQVGSTRTYDIQNKTSPSLGLFTDPDSNDTVTYNSKAVSGNGWEVKAFDFGKIGTEQVGLVPVPDGWKANSQQGINIDAISVSCQSGKLTVRYNRKVDAAMKIGAPFVRVPLSVYGIDSMGKTAETHILLEIHNAAPTLTEITAEANLTNNKGYTILKDEDKNEYTLDIRVEKGAKPKTIDFASFFKDPDTEGGDRSNCDVVRYIGDPSDTRSLIDIDRDSTKKHTVFSNSSPQKALFEIKTLISGSQATGRVTNTGLEISGLTFDRGDFGFARLELADSADGVCMPVNIRITVANTKATVIDANKLKIDILGSDGSGSAAGGSNLAPVYFNILNYVTDANITDAVKFETLKEGEKAPNYLRISAMSLGDTSNESNGKVLQHPPLAEGEETNYDNVFTVGQMFEDEEGYNPQVFFITPRVGVYGWQMLSVTVVDDGNNFDADDALEYQFKLIVYIARDPSTLTSNVIEVVRGRERTVNISQILDRKVTDSSGTRDLEFSGGYTLKKISLKDQNNERAITLTNDFQDDRVTPRFRIKALPAAKEKTEYDIVAECSIGANTSANVDFKLLVTENKKPWLNATYDGQAKTFYGADETNGLVILKPLDIFNDDYPGVGTVLVFESVSSNMTSVCEANLDKSNNQITLNFKANRQVELTVKVHDETGETVTEVIQVLFPEKDDLGFFASAIVYVSSNPLLFTIIFSGFLLFLLILIIIILAVKKKRRMRKEIEALLVSEMEMEEQMLRLSAGSQSPSYFNSFGYLPPTQVGMNAPLLGQGGVPSQGVAPGGAIGLNPGSPNGPANPPPPQQ